MTLTTIGFGDYVALQQYNSLQETPEYVAFALFFIMFGLAIVAASLNLMVLKFMTMNTEDERRDEQQAMQVSENTRVRSGYGGLTHTHTEILPDINKHAPKVPKNVAFHPITRVTPS